MAMIEREAVIEALEQAADYYSYIDECTEHTIRQCISAIKKIPTIDPIRAAGGCRCGECIRFDTTGYENMDLDMPELWMGRCAHWRRDTQACGFCSFGEPREAKGDG